MQAQITNFYKNIKINKQFLLLGLILSFIIGINNIFGESNYSMSLVKNSYYTKGSTEFSVYIESTKNEFTLTSYQCAIKFRNVDQSSNLIFKYVAGSSELENEPNLYVGIENIDGERELTFVSYIGKDNLTTKKKLVGKFIVEGIDYEGFVPYWNFDGNITTIITGNDFNNITDSSNHIFALSEIGDDEKNNSSIFNLSQNFPNPFNHKTKILFEMREEANVCLLVYNLLGEKLNEVFDEFLGVGVHEIIVNAHNLSSGIYLYQLQIGNKFSSIKKMILIK